MSRRALTEAIHRNLSINPGLSLSLVMTHLDGLVETVVERVSPCRMNYVPISELFKRILL